MITVESRIPHLMSERSKVVLGSVRFCTPRFWVWRVEIASLRGELERPILLRVWLSDIFWVWRRILLGWDCQEVLDTESVTKWTWWVWLEREELKTRDPVLCLGGSWIYWEVEVVKGRLGWLRWVCSPDKGEPKFVFGFRLEKGGVEGWDWTELRLLKGEDGETWELSVVARSSSSPSFQRWKSILASRP